MKTYINEYICVTNELDALEKKEKNFEDLVHMETLLDLYSQLDYDLSKLGANELRPDINPFVPEEYKL